MASAKHQPPKTSARGSAKHRPSKPEQGSDTPVDNDVHGEGNYSASRRFNDAERAFVESGRVDEGAREAAPNSEAEALEMDAAEREARSRAREEDPALTKPWPNAANDEAKSRHGRRK